MKTAKSNPNEPAYEDVEEIFVCTDKNKENACSLINDFKLSKKAPTCYDKHLGIMVNIFKEQKELFLTKDNRMLASEQETSDDCLRLKK